MPQLLGNSSIDDAPVNRFLTISKKIQYNLAVLEMDVIVLTKRNGRTEKSEVCQGKLSFCF